MLERLRTAGQPLSADELARATMVAKGLLVDAVALRRVAGMVKGALEAELARHRVGHAASVQAVIAANVHNAEIVDQEFREFVRRLAR